MTGGLRRIEACLEAQGRRPIQAVGMSELEVARNHDTGDIDPWAGAGTINGVVEVSESGEGLTVDLLVDMPEQPMPLRWSAPPIDAVEKHVSGAAWAALASVPARAPIPSDLPGLDDAIGMDDLAAAPVLTTRALRPAAAPQAPEPPRASLSPEADDDTFIWRADLSTTDLPEIDAVAEVAREAKEAQAPSEAEEAALDAERAVEAIVKAVHEARARKKEAHAQGEGWHLVLMSLAAAAMLGGYVWSIFPMS